MDSADPGTVLKISLPSPSRFLCSEANCFMSFDTKSLLEQHLKLHIRKQYRCQQYRYNEVFSSPALCKEHMRGHHGYASSKIDCLKLVSIGQHPNDLAMRTELSAGFKEPIQSSKGIKPYICTFSDCGKTYPSPYKLQEHLRSHSADRPFTCDQCDASFSSKMSCNRHKLLHEDKKNYKCTYAGCSKQFRRADGLREHERIHSGCKIYVCELSDCGRGFSSLSSLKVHMQRHTGERPFKCDHVGCGKSYLTSSNLKAHAKLHAEVKMTSQSFSTAKQLLSSLLSLNDHPLHSYALPEVYSPQGYLNFPDDLSVGAIKQKNMSSMVENKFGRSKSSPVRDGFSLPSSRLDDNSSNFEEHCRCIDDPVYSSAGSREDMQNIDFLDVLTGGIDMNEVTAAALGEVACVQYITSSISDSLSILEERDVSLNGCLKPPKQRSHSDADLSIVADEPGLEVELSHDVNSCLLRVRLESSSERDMSVMNVMSAQTDIMNSDDAVFCTEPSMELSTGHMEIDCGRIVPYSLVPDHIYLQEGSDLGGCAHQVTTAKIEDIR